MRAKGSVDGRCGRGWGSGQLVVMSLKTDGPKELPAVKLVLRFAFGECWAGTGRWRVCSHSEHRGCFGRAPQLW